MLDAAKQMAERVGVGGSRRSRAATQRCFKFCVFLLTTPAKYSKISTFPVDSRTSHGERFADLNGNKRLL